MHMPSQKDHETDVIPASGGDLTITFFGHASLRFTFGGKEIYTDPFGEAADYSGLPKADLLLITHDHFDHCDEQAVAAIRTERTQAVMTAACAAKLGGGIVMNNGDFRTVAGIPIEAVPAYNILHKRENGRPYHIRGDGNGYVAAFGGTRIYIAGDTEYIPEMKELQNIAIAFLPVNVPYTMTPEMAADAARVIRPRILYPYHFGQTDLSRLTALLQDEEDIEIRLRRMA
jgi:L-ascorbate metabolism protein UlaG (beta-lactamase superfamily)